MSASRIPDEPATWAQAFYWRGQFQFGPEGGLIPFIRDRKWFRANRRALIMGVGPSKMPRPTRRRRVPVVFRLGPEWLELHVYDFGGPAWPQISIANTRRARFTSYQCAMRRLMKESS